MNFSGLAMGFPAGDRSGSSVRVAACAFARAASGAALVVAEPHLVTLSPTVLVAVAMKTYVVSGVTPLSPVKRMAKPFPLM